MRVEAGDSGRAGTALGPAEWPPTLMSCVVGVGGAPRGVAKGNRRLTSSASPSASRSGLVGNGIGDRYVEGDSSCSRLCRCDGDANAGVAGVADVAGATSAPLGDSAEAAGDGRARLADGLRETLGDAVLLSARGVTTPSAAAATEAAAAATTAATASGTAAASPSD